MFNFGIVFSFSTEKNNDNSPMTLKQFHKPKPTIESVYDSLHLYEKGLSRNAFLFAIYGYKELKEEGILRNDSIITIVDFDQPSYKKRMYVIDIKHYKIIFNTWTAHGKNTGLDVARYFSNKIGSNKSSLGLYITDYAYIGENGLSLKLIGLDKNNFNAEERAIVLHGADYVSQQVINASGYIGRSFGCPAVSEKLNRPIINRIKGGSCFFIYHHAYEKK